MTIAVMGVDPGVRGGLAVLKPDGTLAHVSAFRPDMTRKELGVELRTAFGHLHTHLSRVCFIEKVGYIRGDGGQGAFTFGRVTGMLEMGAEMLNLDVQEVYPMTWQAKMECLSGGDKNVTKRRAAKLWPMIKWTHATADAALIAEYGRRRLSAVV